MSSELTDRSARSALAALVAGAILIGLAPIFVRQADVGYTAAGFWRALLALPVLAGLMLPRGGLRAFAPAGIAPLLLAGVFFAGDLGLWHQSLRLTSVANATLMTNLAPVFVTLASFAFFGERFRRSFIAGLLLALGGAAVLVSASLQLGAGSALGDLLGVASAVFYAAYIMSVAKARSRFGTVQLMFWVSCATAAVLLAAALAAGENIWPQSLRGWLILLGLALLSHCAGQGLIAYALAHLPAAFSAVGLLVQPVAAAIFAWMILQEPFGSRQAIGGAIVLAGIVTCRLALTPPEKLR